MMSDNKQPSGLTNMLRAVAGALPFVPRDDTVPDRTLTVDELSIDPANVAAYAHVTGLRFGDTVPLTYPFVADVPDGDVTGERLRLPFRRNGFGAHREPHHPVPADRRHRHRRRFRCTPRTCGSTARAYWSTS